MPDYKGKGTSPKMRALNSERAVNAKNKELEIAGLETGNKVPQAIDIEEAVLGALMLDPETVVDAVGELSPDCFYKQENRKIYNAICKLAKDNKAVDIYTVAQQLKANGDFDEVGGSVYLTQLSLKIGAAAHLDYHIKILVDKYIQRKMISIALNALKKSYDDSEPVDGLLDNTQQDIFELAERSMSKDSQSVKDVVSRVLDKLEKDQGLVNGQTGLNSGYSAVDKVTYGWQKSNLIIIAGRPGMGKTAFVLTMARNMTADFNIPVAFFSLEQSPEELAQRLLLAESGLSAAKIKGAEKMKDSDWTQLNDRISKLVDAPLYIDPTPALTITDFRAKARRLVQTKGVKLIIIDYLQLMSGSRELKGFREQEVAEISRSLKAVAKELEVPIIALAQLNRSTEIRGGNKKPQLTDLRESGAIEQDADIVMFLHRPQYYEALDKDIPDGLTQVILAKHRNGPTAEIDMRFIAREMRFEDMNEGVQMPDLDGSDAPMSFSSRMNKEDDLSDNSFEE